MFACRKSRKLLRRLTCFGLALFACLFGFSSSAYAARRAVLVGVSELALQTSALWLQAPRNDVIAMRQALLEQGFRGEDIVTLADGVDGALLPDSTSIQAELTRQAEISQTGDTILLYFSGHGMRAKSVPKDYQEPDRLSEVFLARDAMGATPGARADSSNVTGILRDDQLGIHLQNLLARGVFVLAIFDTCASASMTRGNEAGNIRGENADIRWRGLRPGQLVSVPGSTQSRSAKDVALMTNARASSARYVALYASESHQLTPELRLPRGSRQGKIHGLLTWSLLQSLGKRPQTYREWFNQALENYAPVLAELERLFPSRELPSPVAEGALDAPLWRNPASPLTTQPEWLARLFGNRLQIMSGQLDGLVEQQLVRVTAIQSNGQRSTATARLEQVGLQSASLTAPSPLLKNTSNPVWLVSPANTEEPPAAHALLVQSDSPFPVGVNLDYPLAIRLSEDSNADVRVLRVASKSNASRTPESPIVPTASESYRIEPLPGLAAPLANWLDKDIPLDASRLRSRLVGLAQLKWWHRLATLSAGLQLPGFEVSHEMDRPVSGKPQRSLLIRNRRPQSLDVVVASLEHDGKTQLLYPQETHESNRFEAANGAQPAEKRIPLPESRSEAPRQLLILASPAKPRTPPRFFGVSATPDNTLLLRGRATIEAEREVYGSLQNY